MRRCGVFVAAPMGTHEIGVGGSTLDMRGRNAQIPTSDRFRVGILAAPHFSEVYERFTGAVVVFGVIVPCWK